LGYEVEGISSTSANHHFGEPICPDHRSNCTL
jgi:hypothetical protein